MNVFEVGVGIGSVIFLLFDSMGEDVIDFIWSYIYIDVLFGFFEMVKSWLEKWRFVVEYKMFDIFEDLVK